MSSNHSLIGQTIDIEGFTVKVESKIADGGFGSIYKCVDNSGTYYALKEIFTPSKERKEASLNEFILHMSVCFDPHIVQVFSMSESQTRFYVLMEYCPGSLVSTMNQNFSSRFSVDKIIEIFACICEAVNTIHSVEPPIIHRDLKVENVLWNGTNWKLCDFGSATRTVYIPTAENRNLISADISTNTTPIYRAPEEIDLFRGDEIGTKSDIWALGCILYKLCTFSDAFTSDSTLQILQCKVKWPTNPPIDQRLRHIIEVCFGSHPNDRPTAEQLLGILHKYFPDKIDSKWGDFDMNIPATPAQPISFQEGLSLFSSLSKESPKQDQKKDKNQKDAVNFSSPIVLDDFDEESNDERLSENLNQPDPFASFDNKPTSQSINGADPFASFEIKQGNNTSSDPFASFGSQSNPNNENSDPFASFGSQSNTNNENSDPFASFGSQNDTNNSNNDPFASFGDQNNTNSSSNDPFASNNN